MLRMGRIRSSTVFRRAIFGRKSRLAQFLIHGVQFRLEIGDSSFTLGQFCLERFQFLRIVSSAPGRGGSRSAQSLPRI